MRRGQSVSRERNADWAARAGSALSLAVGLLLCAGCTSAGGGPGDAGGDAHDAAMTRDAGSSEAGSSHDAGCATGYFACDKFCCRDGMRCQAGQCVYPYDTAHLYVYLCPSFNTGSCRTDFFGWNESCEPIVGATPGSCYDTGIEVQANSTVALASCTACGGGCSNPVSIRTPPGFLSRNYYSGSSWHCGSSCSVPPDCGGRAELDAGTQASRCSTADCWLEALSVQELGQNVPLVAIAQALPPTGAGGNSAPSFTSFNGVVITSTQTTVQIEGSHQPQEGLPFEYDFDDPSGCSPAVCFSIPSCPRNVRCAAGTKTVCTRAKRDGALAGSVIRTLGFRAEPSGPAAEVALQVQAIAGSMDTQSGACRDPIDESDPEHPKFRDDVLVSPPLTFAANLVSYDDSNQGDAGLDAATSSDAAWPAAGSGGSTTDAGVTGAGADICCCDFRVSDTMWHCTHSARSDALCNVPWPDCCSTDYTVCE